MIYSIEFFIHDIFGGLCFKHGANALDGAANSIFFKLGIKFTRFSVFVGFFFIFFVLYFTKYTV